MVEENLRHVPLVAVHHRSGARMVAFAGWEMPITYSGINLEHLAVRKAAGIFDVSHMGQIAVEGSQATEFLDHLLTRDIAAIALGRMAYSPMCNEAGGTVDDLLVYHVAAGHYLLVVNAAREAEDWQWIKAQAEAFDVVCQLHSDQWAMVALQGPDAPQILQRVSGRSYNLRYYQFSALESGGWVGRNGYTGEAGFEIICPPDQAEAWWSKCCEAGALPCGLAARDTLRTEMGFCLYGHELDESTSPLEAGLGWAVHLDGGDFIGKEAMMAQVRGGLKRRLVGIKMLERGIPRPGYELILPQDDDRERLVIGSLTSGTYSPSLECGIGLGMVQSDCCANGTKLAIDMRGRLKKAEIVALPFIPMNVR
jgi:aminomethyltransferase